MHERLVVRIVSESDHHFLKSAYGLQEREKVSTLLFYAQSTCTVISERERVSNLFFYAQSSSTFISGRQRERERERERERSKRTHVEQRLETADDVFGDRELNVFTMQCYLKQNEA